MDTTTNTIVSTHYTIAELIAAFGGWDVKVANDDAGIYISMANPEKDSDHRGMSLSDDENGSDLNLYRWRFWNETEGVWFDSTLGVDASAEEILGFLSDCVAEEKSLPLVVSE